MDLATIIAYIVHYFKELIAPLLFMANEVSRAHHEFYDVVGCIVHDLLSNELGANFTKYHLNMVLSHLPSG